MSKRGKAIGSYFTMDMVQRINFEYLKSIVSNKLRLRIRDKVEIQVTKDSNRKAVIAKSKIQSNMTIYGILLKLTKG